MRPQWFVAALGALPLLSCGVSKPDEVGERAPYDGTEAEWYASLSQEPAACDADLRVLGGLVATFENGRDNEEGLALQARQVAEKCSTARKMLLSLGVPSTWPTKAQADANAALDLCADAYLRKARLGHAIVDRLQAEQQLASLLTGLEKDLEVHEKCISAINSL